MIVIVDTPPNIDRYLPQLEDLDVHGITAIDDVEVARAGYLTSPNAID